MDCLFEDSNLFCKFLSILVCLEKFSFLKWLIVLLMFVLIFLSCLSSVR